MNMLPVTSCSRSHRLDQVIALHHFLRDVIPSFGQVLEIPTRLLGDDEQGAARCQGNASRLNKHLGDPEVGIVGRVSEHQVVAARVGDAAVSLQCHR